MKKIFLCLVVLSTLLVTGCLKYEISTEIFPKVVIAGRNLGLTYKLGDISVSDQLKCDPDILSYINDHPKSKFYVKITYDSFNSSRVTFKYSVNGIIIGEKYDVVNAQIINARRSTIPGFACLYGDCKLDKSIQSLPVKQKKENDATINKPQNENKTMNKKAMEKL